MIWLRRFLALVLSVPVLALLPATLLITRVNATLLEPEFYIAELQQADTYQFLTGELLEALAAELQQAEGPLPLPTAELVGVVRRVVPTEWLQQQVEQGISQVLPYATGSTESFRITIPLVDRVEAALEALRALLTQPSTYDLLLDEVVAPLLEERLGQSVELPIGLSLTPEDVDAALRQVLTQEWLREQAEQLIAQVGPYLTGETDTFLIVVPLEDRLDAAFVAVDELLTRKLTEKVASLPTCSPEQETTLRLEGLPDGELPCLPPGFGVDQLRKALGLDFSAGIRQSLEEQLPKTLEFTEAHLQQALNGLGDSRDGEGREGAEMLEEARRVIREGITFTEKEWRERLRAQDREGAERLEDLSRLLGRARPLLPLTYLLPGLLLAAIGFLGGRHAASRLAWAAAVLLVAAGLSYAAAGPGYQLLAEPRLAEALAKTAAEAEGFQRLILDKVSSLVLNMVGDFLSGVELRALLLLLASGGVLLVVGIRSSRSGASPKSPA